MKWYILLDCCGVPCAAWLEENLCCCALTSDLFVDQKAKSTREARVLVMASYRGDVRLVKQMLKITSADCDHRGVRYRFCG